ncbi:MAG: radical SAM protein [Desulfosarcina sp.]|nr:radical SAM protein [Desulfobacterales bacterium]
MAGCFNPLAEFEFSPQEIEAAVQRNGLLSMEIEFSRRCNYKCPYCYVPREVDLAGEMTRAEIRDVLRQARQLGARKIIILGGEPTIYPHILEMIDFICDQGMGAEMFTNGSGIDAAFASQRAAMRVRVVLKMNSFDARIQDRLTGIKGSWEQTEMALGCLKAAGYPGADLFLAVSTIICQENLAEIPALWQWLRDQGIAPYFEMITPQANAVDHPELQVPSEEIQRVFREIARIDREQYGHDWEPQPPLMGNKCLRHRFSCLVTAQGEVMPCVGVTIPIGNVKSQPLAAILLNSQVIKDLKNHRETIKGFCRVCEKADECYGCRGAAYQMTGDYLASDPLCWKHSGGQE